MNFTVAICTYNGADRLPAVLDHLQNQQGTEDLQWEVLVVDNNSSDATKDVVFHYIEHWHGNGQLNYIFEPKQGVSHARDTAIATAASRDLVGFLDDDNLPSKTWVAEAYTFGQVHPKAGAYGGIIHAKLDQSPPDYFDRIKILLAVYNHGSQPFQYHRNAKPRRIPAAPGSVIRKQAWQECITGNLLLLGRDEAGKTMLGACEDLEVMYRIQNSNWEVWHNPKMEVSHHIPSRRLERDYLLKVARTSALSNHALRTARLHSSQRFLITFLTPLYAISDAYKALSYYLKYRQQLPHDVAKACEFESRKGRLLSPFVGIF